MASGVYSGHTVYFTGSGGFVTTSGATTLLDDDGLGDPSAFELGEIIVSTDEAFQGTVTIDGVPYPVVDNGVLTVVYGIQLTSADYPTVASLGPLDSSDFTPCFLADTRIATPEGEVRVDALAIGDTILTSSGAPVAVKWVGHKTIMTRFGAAERLMPVRLAAGSLGNGLPHTDLTVTADHALLIDGVLCNASALVNGATITRVPLAEMGAEYTVFHIETEAHEIILANGAPAETFIDNVSRRAFDNFAEYHALYGEETQMQELPLPRALTKRQLPQSLQKTFDNQSAA